MPLALGQGSGDFRETSGRVQIFHLGIRNTWGILTPDAFTQVNPPIIPNKVSTTLAGITRIGVLGGSIAFTRPDAGNGYHGGPIKVSGAYVNGQRPLGLFLNDAIGNPYENTPGVASRRGTFINGQATVGVTLWETQEQIGVGAITYEIGDRLYASVNGLLTNQIQDSYEYQVVADPNNVTVIGVVRVVPDSQNSLMVLDMRI